MNSQAVLPKLSLNESKFLMERIADLRRIMDVYKMIIENSALLRGTEAEAFIGLAQKAMRLEIHIGFIAVITGHGLKKFLNSDPLLISIQQKLNTIKKDFDYVRDKYLAHMDFDFDFEQIPQLTLQAVEEHYKNLMNTINQISAIQIVLPVDTSKKIRNSLQFIIDLVKNDKDGTDEI